MKHINQRNIRIIDELMCFCYKHGATKIDINISTIEKVVTIRLSSNIESLDTTVLENMKRLLNAPRCHEMEEYYWELTGDDDTDSELTLVGMMTDEAYVNYVNSSQLEIVLKRRL
jgi:hypothetical protein